MLIISQLGYSTEVETLIITVSNFWDVLLSNAIAENQRSLSILISV